MLQKKKILILVLLTAFVVVSVAAVNAPKQRRNLKILPQDISEAKLDSIMESYNKALGVKCEFCHAKAKANPAELDFAADTEPMKANARKMMEMTIELNKKWFYFTKEVEPVYLTTVTCITCHRGEAFPEQDH
jgi:Photosynthetic reaction centre cytochrome C subunit